MLRAILLSLVALALTQTAQAQLRPARLSVALGQGQAIELENVPDWLKAHDFPHDAFTFVRIQYDSPPGRNNWATDFPDADLNLAAQLGSLTKLDVSKPSRVLRLTDPDLKSYPFCYLAEAGSLRLSDAEVSSLREYLDGGGFLLIDDFWGEAEWANVRAELNRVFPDREPEELPLMHPIFYGVFRLDEKPQVPSINVYLSGRTTERADAAKAHYRAYLDDDDRVQILLCHNTDLADGWERTGHDARYTREMSQKRALPLGINILFYALSHRERDEQ